MEGTSTRLFKESKGGYIPCGSLLIKDFTRLLEISRTVGCLGTGRRHGLWMYNENYSRSLNQNAVEFECVHYAGKNSARCGCIRKTTHGLLCACELSRYVVGTIPLDTI